ncbi:outer membrane insertion C-terminal signal protein [Allomuricauda ruestringensis DSM 13258]|uniref:Outer membrane insertion C-terminal signal protein n=1 Tax=Allomuricauda ruestringensis (strain DSM 13258 / CIP 107369 / LMG 19739 / B1) TaxID=886377 RepID=G2PMP8_ALLRU|nr:TonB-dependent receptor [Allomuricauda ruestringensis]AEM70155.1 outer membrane insertion C-terminal signal protein [Allomuricauda ruestringensis DSM 13258]
MKRIYLAFAAIFISAMAFAQGTLTGTVVDGELGGPLPGASVVVKGTSNGTSTDFDGNFTLEVNQNSGTLIVSYIGFIKKQVEFTSTGNLGTIELLPDAQELGEVVVIGSGIIDLEEDRSTPIAVTTIKRDEIQAVSAGNVEFPEVMKNVPSVYVSNQTGFGDSQMFLRGFDQTNTAFLLNGQPINGMEDGRMYWSNWAGMADIANAVQVQRGLGSSKLAISSVGGTVNIVSKATEKREGGFGRFMVGNDSFFKTTASYDSGINENGWGFSVMLDHWQGQRKFAEGTKGQGQNYFFSVGKLIGDHNFNFLVFGAPQWHMQRWSQPLEVVEAKRKYNQHWGFDEGELESERTNFYHKPVMNLNWDWNISDKLDLSTVLYASWGRGGGTGPRGNSALRLPDYPVAGGIDGQIDYAATRARNAQVGIGGDYGAPNGAGYIRRASMNNHQWYGMVSNFSHDLNDNLSFNVGADFRFYTGDHFRQVADFYGLSGWSNDRPDDRVVTESFSINPWKTLTTFADEDERINYDYSEDINYQGMFGQVEYAEEAFSVFFQGAISNQSYQREDRFATDINGNQTTQTSDKANKFGYNVKSGGAYNFDEKNTVYANAGFYSRQPFLDNIFSGTAELADPEVENEEITGLEIGYKFNTYDFQFTIDLYRTEWANRFIANGNTIIDIATDAEVDINREQTDVTQLHQGVELTARWRAAQGLIIGAYTSIGDWVYSGSTPYRTRDFRDNTYFTNAQIDDYTDQNGNPLPANFFDGNVNLDGVEISNAPQFAMGLNADYDFANGFEVGLDVNHFSNLYEFNDVADVVAEGNSYETSKLDAYTLFDMTAAYTFDFGTNKMELRTNVYNLFNHAYLNQTDAFGVFYGNGRTFNASVTYRF